LVDVDLAARPARSPGIAGHVGGRGLAGGGGAVVEQAGAPHAKNAGGLIGEEAERAGQITLIARLPRAPGMALVAKPGGPIGQLPADPLGNIVSAAHILWVEASSLFREIHHDRARFEDRDRRTTAHRLVVNDRRHPAVWRNSQKVGGELIAFADV